MDGMEDKPPTDAVPGSTSSRKRKSSSVLPVVGPCASGEGLPYAPEDWPRRGDKWRWRVGSRLTVSGHYHDRFIYPPARLGKPTKYCVKGGWIASKISLAQFLREMAPEADLDAFFASFEWHIPSPSVKADKDIKRRISTLPYSKKLNVNGLTESRTTLKPRECKAGNKTCPPRAQTRNDALHVMDCDICCTEDGFCRDCCCILCCKTTGSMEEGYSFIKCEAIISHKYICGHLAHLECAVNARMAGTVLGNIGLDAEYYCRRCDNKHDIVPLLKRLLDDCKSLKSRKHIQKFLDLGLRTLHFSKKTEAQKLQRHIESVIVKLRDGVKLENIWISENSAQIMMAGGSNAGEDVIMLDAQNGTDGQEGLCIVDGPKEYVDGPGASDLSGTAKIQSLTEGFTSTDDQSVSLELQNKIVQALADLKKAQESEYLLAEKELYTQKDLLLGIYRELDSGRLQLECPISLPSATNLDTIMTDDVSKVQRMKQENSKLEDMMQIAKGFGKASEVTLKFFGTHPV